MGTTRCNFVVSNLAGTAVAKFLQLGREMIVVLRDVNLLVSGRVTEWQVIDQMFYGMVDSFCRDGEYPSSRWDVVLRYVEKPCRVTCCVVLRWRGRAPTILRSCLERK